jgi:hypothetical protein
MEREGLDHEAAKGYNNESEDSPNLSRGRDSINPADSL